MSGTTNNTRALLAGLFPRQGGTNQNGRHRNNNSKNENNSNNSNNGNSSNNDSDDNDSTVVEKEARRALRRLRQLPSMSQVERETTLNNAVRIASRFAPSTSAGLELEQQLLKSIADGIKRYASFRYARDVWTANADYDVPSLRLVALERMLAQANPNVVRRALQAVVNVDVSAATAANQLRALYTEVVSRSALPAQEVAGARQTLADFVFQKNLSVAQELIAEQKPRRLRAQRDRIARDFALRSIDPALHRRLLNVYDVGTPPPWDVSVENSQLAAERRRRSSFVLPPSTALHSPYSYYLGPELPESNDNATNSNDNDSSTDVGAPDTSQPADWLRENSWWLSLALLALLFVILIIALVVAATRSRRPAPQYNSATAAPDPIALR